MPASEAQFQAAFQRWQAERGHDCNDLPMVQLHTHTHTHTRARTGPRSRRHMDLLLWCSRTVEVSTTSAVYVHNSVCVCVCVCVCVYRSARTSGARTTFCVLWRTREAMRLFVPRGAGTLWPQPGRITLTRRAHRAHLYLSTQRRTR